MLRTLTAISLILPLLPCQQQKPLKPRQFLFDDYTSVVHLDMKRVCDLEIWETVVGSPLGVVLAKGQEEIGFPLERLDAITTVFRWDDAEKEMREITVLEGHAPLTRAEDRYDRWIKDEIHGQAVLRDSWAKGGLSFDWTDKVRIEGREQFLAPVLAGKPRIGLPAADVMSLTVGIKDLLGYVVFDLRTDSFRNVFLRDVMPDASWPEGDAPTFFCARVAAIGDPDDSHVQLEMVVRHGKAGAGVAATQKQVEAGIQQLLDEPKLRLIRPMLKKIKREVDGSDAIWRVDLGRSRNVVGNLAGMSLPWLFLARGQMQAVQAQAQAVQIDIVEAEEVEEEEVEPEEPVPHGGGGGGGN